MIFDWFSFLKDEAFTDEEDFNRYNAKLLREGDSEESKEFDCLMTVQDKEELYNLYDELLVTAKMRSLIEHPLCLVCYKEITEVDEIWIFRDCRHIFCRPCVQDNTEMLINDGHIDKLTCMSFDEETGKPCETRITDQNLKDMGVSVEMRDKIK